MDNTNLVPGTSFSVSLMVVMQCMFHRALYAITAGIIRFARLLTMQWIGFTTFYLKLDFKLHVSGFRMQLFNGAFRRILEAGSINAV